MVTITQTDTETTFEIKGLHKLWALKSEIQIPNQHILSAYQNINEVNEWKLRMIGTHVPYIIKAGTFYLGEGNDVIFMDVMHPEKVIIVELQDERYKKLYIEVEHPEEAITLLKSKHTL